MESLQPQVHAVVLDFMESRVFSPRDVILSGFWVCRLHLQLALSVARLEVEAAVPVVATAARQELMSGGA